MPYSRIVEGEPDVERMKSYGADSNLEYHGKSTKNHKEAGVQDASDVKRRILEGTRRVVTKGFIPSCECNSSRSSSVVLDPFMGSGRTAIAAIKAGRRAIGIELSPTNVEMSSSLIDNMFSGDLGIEL